MIRVFRAESAAAFRADPSGPVVVEGTDRTELEATVARLEDEGRLSHDEARTIERALDDVTGDAADVVLAGDGRIFRVEGEAPASAAPLEWFATDRVSPVLVVCGSGARALLIAEALQFLGYNADYAAVPQDGAALLDRLRQARPHVAVIEEALLVACGSRLLDLSRRGDVIAIVGLGAGGPDGVLETPLRLEAVAPTLERLLDRVRKARLSPSVA
ncbi:MAG TPA: hypothetical protein VFF73_15815 [Planctomycetota bacterium]|nr:hypothetical protein [Planctomycetota bacterium]